LASRGASSGQVEEEGQQVGGEEGLDAQTAQSQARGGADAAVCVEEFLGALVRGARQVRL
jgi:hypothetical protein